MAQPKYNFSDEQIALMRNAVLEHRKVEAVTLREAIEFYEQYSDAEILEWAGLDTDDPSPPSREELFGYLGELVKVFGPDAKPNELLYAALSIPARYHNPWDVLREFVDDLKVVHGTGFAHELDEDGLDWPDLALTYQKACAALAWHDRAKHNSEEPIKIRRWIASGELGEHPDFRSLLDAAGNALDASCASDIVGEVVFESEDGTVHVLSVEGVIAEADPEYVKDVEQRAREDDPLDEGDDNTDPEAEDDEGTPSGPRCMARFQAQAWINDYPVDIDDGNYQFDITEQIAKMPTAEALAVEDDQYSADNLWHEHPISEERPHDGPFRVECQDAIVEYLQAVGRIDENCHILDRED